MYYSDRSLYGHDYLLAKIEPIVAAARPNRIFDLGCGNGSIANRLSKHASVTGIDISDSGVQIANRSFPHLKIEVGSVNDDLAAKYRRFPVVVSLEVVEHLFDPPSFAKTLFDLVRAGSQSSRRRTMATGRIWPSRSRANLTRISLRYGSEDILSSGRFTRCAHC